MYLGYGAPGKIIVAGDSASRKSGSGSSRASSRLRAGGSRLPHSHVSLDRYSQAENRTTNAPHWTPPSRWNTSSCGAPTPKTRTGPSLSLSPVQLPLRLPAGAHPGGHPRDSSSPRTGPSFGARLVAAKCPLPFGSMKDMWHVFQMFHQAGGRGHGEHWPLPCSSSFI